MEKEQYEPIKRLDLCEKILYQCSDNTSKKYWAVQLLKEKEHIEMFEILKDQNK